MTPSPGTAASVFPDVLLIDDLRVFRDEEADVQTARTSADGVEQLRAAHAAGHRWAQIWLDHDLGDATGSEDVIGPVIDWLCRRALSGDPVAVGQILVHTSNTAGGSSMMRALERVGYRPLRLNAEPYLRIDEALYRAAISRESL